MTDLAERLLDVPVPEWVKPPFNGGFYTAMRADHVRQEMDALDRCYGGDWHTRLSMWLSAAATFNAPPQGSYHHVCSILADIATWLGGRAAAQEAEIVRLNRTLTEAADALSSREGGEGPSREDVAQLIYSWRPKVIYDADAPGPLAVNREVTWHELNTRGEFGWEPHWAETCRSRADAILALSREGGEGTAAVAALRGDGALPIPSPPQRDLGGEVK